jgi:ATP-dependent RNA helicase DHX29
MNCTEEELLRDKPSSETDLKTPRTPRTPRIPRAGPAPKTPLLPSHIPAKPIKTSQETLASPSVNLPGSGLDVNAATFVPSSARGPEPEPLSDEGSRPSMSSDLLNSSSSSLRNSPDNDDPHDQYVRLRMEIDALTRNRMSQESRDASHLENLKLQLAAVQEHYFFRVREAEALYKEARQAADAEALRSRLRGDVSSAEPRVRADKKRPPKLKSSAPDTATATVSDSDDSEGGEGMFALLENATTSEMPDGRVIPIRDLGAPKQWSGRTPKMLLAETVHKVDRHAVVSYANTSGHSRAKRATVSVRGDGGQSGTWAMDDVACQSEEQVRSCPHHQVTGLTSLQAEQYISMIALHALTYPPSDGFALGGTSAAGGGQTFFRLLPAVFRDLWDELEEKRKTEHDEINRAAWAKLQSILDGKLRKDKHVSRLRMYPSFASDNASRSRTSPLKVPHPPRIQQAVIMQHHTISPQNSSSPDLWRAMRVMHTRRCSQVSCQASAL